MDEDLPTFEDLLEELETDLAEMLAENPARQAELKRMAQEDRAREEELNRLRRPYHDCILDAFATFARIPLAHLAEGSGRTAKATRERIDDYLGRCAPDFWSHWGKTLGTVARLITDDYFNLEGWTFPRPPPGWPR